MGMGEPMHNLDAVIDAIRRIAEPKMGNLGYRAITVSTVGVIAGIEKLAAANLGVHLALSLHAPDDETRSTNRPNRKEVQSRRHHGRHESVSGSDRPNRQHRILHARRRERFGRAGARTRPADGTDSAPTSTSSPTTPSAPEYPASFTSVPPPSGSIVSCRSSATPTSSPISDEPAAMMSTPLADNCGKRALSR